MADGLRINAGAASHYLTHLDGIGRTLDSTWRTASQELTADEAGIGADAIGQAIRAGYAPAATTVRAVADQVPALFTSAAADGGTAVRAYQDTDRGNAETLRGPQAAPEALA